MKLVLISDTHCKLNQIEIPDGDILIHSGDATFQGTVSEVAVFGVHMQRMKEKFPKGIIFIPGNHDWGFQLNSTLFRDIMGDVKVLIDESIVIDGIKIYGSPVTPWFNNWAFNVYRGDAIKKYWDAIPDDTNILVTHGPPFGILDEVADGEHVGCEELMKRIRELKQMKLHCFGHIHGSYGQYELDGVKYINASSCTERYQPFNPPIVLEI